MQKRRGLWIGIDGPDFTGKKRQVGMLVRTLLEWSEDNIILTTHDPSRKANEIKKALAKDPDPYTNGMKMLDLYTDDRVNTLGITQPILLAGGIVISNRHKPSTDAYQSAQGIPFSETIAMQKRKGIGTPDISFYLVASEAEVRKRMQISIAEKERDGMPLDKFERSIDFQMKVAEQYKILAKMSANDPEYFGEVHLIDADPLPVVVAADISQRLKPKYDSWFASL